MHGAVKMEAESWHIVLSPERLLGTRNRAYFQDPNPAASGGKRALIALSCSGEEHRLHDTVDVLHPPGEHAGFAVMVEQSVEHVVELGKTPLYALQWL